MIMTAKRPGIWETMLGQRVSLDRVGGLADWRVYANSLVGNVRAIQREDPERFLKQVYRHGQDISIVSVADYWDFTFLDDLVDLMHEERTIENVPDHWPYAIVPAVSAETHLVRGRNVQRRVYKITLLGSGMQPSSYLRAWVKRYEKGGMADTDEAIRVFQGEGALATFVPSLSDPYNEEVLEFFASHRIDAVETMTRDPDERDENILRRLEYEAGFGPGLLSVGSSGSYQLDEEGARSEMFLPMSLLVKGSNDDQDETSMSGGLIESGAFYSAAQEIEEMKGSLGHHIYSGTVH